MHSLLESNPRKPDATLHLWNRARKIPKIGQKWHYQDDRCNIIHAVGIFISHHPISQYFITLCMIIHWADWGQTIIACLWVASWCSWHRRTLHELFLFEPFGKPSLSKSSIQTVSHVGSHLAYLTNRPLYFHWPPRVSTVSVEVPFPIHPKESHRREQWIFTHVFPVVLKNFRLSDCGLFEV